ncbi:MAG: peptidoglycan DD-metalloendopeptidase family protein [Steroidobacteraceae bacterium]|jgi:murein DD-endopeptidase MepM/ murein hydrolase activator NlpD|nr:peptidoglycan DD-metalloendopeptidase family protein [Steroidobacteraceae bacterium]
MNLRIVTGSSGRTTQIDLTGPRLLLASVLVLGIFIAGLALGRFLLGGNAEQRAYARAMAQQKTDLQAARGQIDGKVDALAARIGSLNAHLIRLDALGRRLTDLAGLDRGEFDFAKPPPAGGPEGQEAQGGSVQVPELTAVLDTLEEQINDRAQQLGALEMVMASRELGQRIMPGGLPLIGGWISSHFGHRSDPFTGRGAFHAGVDFAGPTGSRVIAVGPGVVTYSGWKQGYGNVVEITHPTGYVTRYGHNSRNLVPVGRSVQKNDAIAVIGSTGRSTGTHVHFEVLRDGNVLNPMKYLDAP